jgi:hypothetical protein
MLRAMKRMKTTVNKPPTAMIDANSSNIDARCQANQPG